MIAHALARPSIAQRGATPRPLQEPLPLGTAVTFATIQQTAVSPDGRWLAYVVRRLPSPDLATTRRANVWTGWPKGLYDHLSVYVMALTDPAGAPRMIGGTTGAAWGVAWAHNGAALAFYSTRSGRPRLWLWETATGALRCLCTVDVLPEGDQIEWLPNDRALIATVLPADGDMTDALKDLWDQAAARQSVRVHEGGIPGADSVVGDWLPVMDLATIDVGTAAMHRTVTRKRIPQHVVSPDGTMLAYVTTEGMRPSTYYEVQSLHVASVRDGLPLVQHLLAEHGVGHRLAWSPSGHRLLSEDAEGDVVYTVDSAPRRVLVMFGSATGCPSSLSASVQSDSVRCVGRHGSCPGWATPGDTLLCLTDDSVVYVAANNFRLRSVAARPSRAAELLSGASDGDRYDQTLYFMTSNAVDRQATIDTVNLVSATVGRLRQFPVHEAIDIPDGALTARASPSAARRCLVYRRQTVNDPPDLWCMPLGARARPDSAGTGPDQRLTHLNPQAEGYATGETRFVSWHNGNGALVYGALLLPPGRFTPPYPLIATVYPWDQWARPDHYDDGGTAYMAHVLATRGYAVFAPNAGPGGPRTETNPWDQSGTVIPGILKLADAGVVDLTRVGVIGKSSGATEVMELITRSNLFKAAVSESGTADWVAFKGVMESPTIQFGQGLTTDPPDLYSNRADVIDRSPIFFFDQVQTPLLVIQGTRDEVGSPFLAEEIFVRLRQLGKPVAYVTYEAETHEYDWWSYEHQIDRMTRVLAWFDLYVMHPRPLGVR